MRKSIAYDVEPIEVPDGCYDGRVRLYAKTDASARKEAKSLAKEYGWVSYKIMMVDLSDLHMRVKEMFW